MPSSKIIRDRHYDRQAQPLALQEAEASAVYQSDWTHTDSNIIRNAAGLPVRAFPLFDASIPAAPTHHAPMLPQTSGAEASSEQSVESDVSSPPTGPEGDDPGQKALYAKAHEQAQALLQQAQEEAERCLATARNKAAQLETEAYEAGWRRGEAEALRQSRELYTSVFRCFEQAAAEVTGLRQQVMRQAEDDIITLAFEIARKLVQHHVQVDPECLTTTLRRALAYVLDDDAIVVRVHPDDLAGTQHLHEDILPSFEAMRHVTIETDETVGRGGCIVEANVGVIDARVASQFAELEQRFREQYTLKTEAQVR
jgi:flagellar biosynthesis/type III secretory pathway protein FliH